MVNEEVIYGVKNIMDKQIDAFTSLASAVTVQQCRLTQLKNQCELMNTNIRGVDSELQDNVREYRTLKNETEEVYHQAKLIQKNIDSLKESRQAMDSVLYEIHKQVNSKKSEIQEDRLEQESILKKYTDIYNEYLEIYESLPLAKVKHALEVKLKATKIQSAQMKIRLQEILEKSRILTSIKKKQHQKLIVKVAEKYVAQKNLLDTRSIITKQIRLTKEKVESMTQVKRKASEALAMGEIKNSSGIKNRLDSLSLFLNKIQTSVGPKEIVCNTTPQIHKLELPHLILDSAPLRKVSLNYDWNALFGKSHTVIRSTAKETNDINKPPEQLVFKENKVTEKNVKIQVEQTSNQVNINNEVKYFKEKESNKNDSSLKLTHVTNKRKLSQVSTEINRKDSLDVNGSLEQKMKTMKVVQQQKYTVQSSQPAETRKQNYVESLMDTLQKKQSGVETLQKKQLTKGKSDLTSYSLKSLIADINSKKNISAVSYYKNVNREDTNKLDTNKEKNISLHQTSVSSNLCDLTSEIKLDKQKQIAHEQTVADITEKTKNSNNSQDIFSQMSELEDSNDSHNLNDNYTGMSPLTPDVVPSPCSIADVCSNQPVSQVRVVNKLDNSDANEYSNIYSPQDYQDYEENYLSLGQVFSPPEAAVGNEDLSEYNIMQIPGTGLTNSGNQKETSASTDNKISSNFSFNFTTGPAKSKIFSLF